jgi:hypothetical protein
MCKELVSRAALEYGKPDNNLGGGYASGGDNDEKKDKQLRRAKGRDGREKDGQPQWQRRGVGLQMAR